MKPLIRTQALWKVYEKGSKKITALKGVDLTFYPGEMVVITGPSGAGKSTLMHLLGTLDKPTQGKIFYLDKELFSLSDKELAIFRNQKVGFLFQFHHLLPEFNALENVMLPALIRGLPSREAEKKAEILLERVGLKDREKHKPGELSGGEQQRVAIARALVLEPELFLADEPTGNLDSETGASIYELIRELNRLKGITTIVVTHNHAMASTFPRRILLRDGEVKEDIIQNEKFKS